MATNETELHDQYEADDKAEKEEVLGSLGGIAVGATVGIAAGPVGIAVGAVAGGLLGAGVASALVDGAKRHSSENAASVGENLGDTHSSQRG